MNEAFRKVFRPIIFTEIKRVSNDYKMLGQAAMQVVYNKSKTKIVKILHFPMETLRAEKCDAKGVIRAYYYHPKWVDIKPSDNPKRIPSFGNGKKSETAELYIFKPYRSGFYYYAPVDYHGCLQYCSLEEEVSNYHINNIKQGLQPSLLINFNNGVPNEETQELIERKIYDKFSGTSNAGKFILAFKSFPVDLTLTNNSFSKSFLSFVIMFKFFKLILVLTRCSLAPTMISFFSAIIFTTYKGFISEIPIPFR